MIFNRVMITLFYKDKEFDTYNGHEKEKDWRKIKKGVGSHPTPFGDF